MPGLSALTLANMATGATGRPMWPSDLTGLILWLPADQIQGVASGTSLSVWTDSSASASHATQPSVASQPVFFVNVQNGLSAVSFGGGSVSQFMQSPTSIVDTSTFAIVAQPSALTNATERYVGGATGNTPSILKRSVSAPSLFLVTTEIQGTAAGSIWQSVIGSFFTSAGSSIATLTQNASLFTSSSLSGLGIQAQLANIGATNASTQTLRGWIGEILIYNRNVTESERSSLASYLRQKWGTA